MGAQSSYRSLTPQGMEAILSVTSKLAAPFDLLTMLDEVVEAAKYVLDAEAGSVWMHDPDKDELILEVAKGVEPVRIALGVGLVGTSARSREVINVPDCYADPRFNPEMDRQTNQRTRCLLTLPLIDHEEGDLIGVMQVMNKRDGTFDDADIALATALAAQCVVAIQRVRSTEALLEGERMRQSLEVARTVQLSTLPERMPDVHGYDLYGTFRPADLTGGDTFDLVSLDQGLFILVGDATGHGIAPALSATQMQAMLRVAFRLQADLDSAFVHVNNQLHEDLPADRFVTAFVGFLDPQTHRVTFQSGGQGPIVHFHAATATCTSHRPTSFPLAAMPLDEGPVAAMLDLEPGDILAVVTDGVYEYAGPEHEEFGEERVYGVLRAHHQRPTSELAEMLVASVLDFAQGAPQDDDITVVLVKRAPQLFQSSEFERKFDALPQIFECTAGFAGRARLGPDPLRTVDFVVEELFTNMVKYSRESDAKVRMDLQAIPGGVEVTLADFDVEPFDVTAAPEVDITLTAAERRPGGLGLHLIRKMVDSIEYQYAGRQSTITFRVSAGEQ